MHKYKYYNYTRKINVSFIMIVLVLSSLSSIILFTVPVRACSIVDTFESDYVTPKTTFLQGEIVYGKGTSFTIGHYKLRILDPSDNVTYCSNPVSGKEVTCSWVLDEDASIGEWDLQVGEYLEGSWYWNETANFDVIAMPEYTLTININSLGAVAKDPDQETYTYGTLVNLSAIDDSGWTFDHWSGDLNGSENPTAINMISNKTVIAHFKKGSTSSGGNTGGNANGGAQKGDSGNNDVENLPPIASLLVGEPRQGFVNSKIIFNGSLSYDPDGSIVSWEWDFGDGTNGEGEITTHSYSTAGTYTVILTVTDNNGATNSSENSVLVIKPNNPPSNPEINNPVKGNKNIEEPVGENSAIFILVLLALVPLIPLIIFSRRNKVKGKVRGKKVKRKK